MDNDLKNIYKELRTIEKHLAVYNEQLTYHIKRTDQAEARIARLEAWLLGLLTSGILLLVGVLTKSVFS